MANSETKGSSLTKLKRQPSQNAVVAIREGLADKKAGRTKPARAALRALAKKHGIKSWERSRPSI